jgi:hypothetical protein
LIKKRQNYILSELVENIGSETNDDLLISIENLLEIYKKRRNIDNYPKIPISLFSSKKLGILEVLVKCLKENYSFNYSNIGRLLNRNPRTIWAAYNLSLKKEPERFHIEKESVESLSIPSTVFSDRNLAPLESLVIYLKDTLDIDFKNISKLLFRDYKTIWLSYQHGIKKRIQNG